MYIYGKSFIGSTNVQSSSIWDSNYLIYNKHLLNSSGSSVFENFTNGVLDSSFIVFTFILLFYRLSLNIVCYTC